MEDMSPEAQEAKYERLRKMTATEKMTLMFELMEAEREAIREGIRQKYPYETEQERKLRFIAAVLPREDVINGFGFDPATFFDSAPNRDLRFETA